MTAKKDYLFNTALSTTATITAIERSDDRVSIKLDLTNFHPQGGGQKADLGTIAGVRVIHVAHDEGDISHYVESAEGLKLVRSSLIETRSSERSIAVIVAVVLNAVLKR